MSGKPKFTSGFTPKYTANHAHILALETVLAHVFDRLCEADPKMTDAISKGLDDASAACVALAAKEKGTKRGDHLATTLDIIDEFKGLAIGKHYKPRHGV